MECPEAQINKQVFTEVTTNKYYQQPNYMINATKVNSQLVSVSTQ